MEKKGGKGGAQPIAYATEDLPLVDGDSLAEKQIMPRDGRLHRLGLALPAGGAALDIGVEEGDGPGR